MTYRIAISTWYNYRGGSGYMDAQTCDLAVSDAPELGYSPHAVAVMRHYVIKYAEASSHPISDSWLFRGCDSYPANREKWMRVYDEATGLEVTP